MEDKKVLLSLKNVDVKFNVRGRTLSAIRNVSLNVYENESLAIVGESGSGKSVLTKTFAGMLDSNGYISNGSIILSDDEISKTDVVLEGQNERLFNQTLNMLNELTPQAAGAAEFAQIKEKEREIRYHQELTPDEEADFAERIKDIEDDIIDCNNYLWNLDKKTDAEEIAQRQEALKQFNENLKKVEEEKKELLNKRISEYKADTELQNRLKKEIEDLKAARTEKINAAGKEVSQELQERNKRIAYEVILSIGRYPWKDKLKYMRQLKKNFAMAVDLGEDLSDPETLNHVFEDVTFRVEYRSYDEATKTVHGYAIIDCAKIKYTNDWQRIRGCRIATVFQDPMTSLNPVLTIGKQIMTVILKHQKCTNAEARQRTLDIMEKVGIPDPEKRFDDYPFEYSGGMRQRIVIAIALSCQPKILICDEPTTALDVTIQAQIIRLIKDLQKQLGFTTVYITHDLGVVANVAERVAVMYGGQIVEIGSIEDIFYDPKHPYTWALLSSLPQLATRGDELFSIEGTPPSLYNKITGDAFAPRNQYALAVDFVEEPPMFKVSDTHYAKTWLLDPRAPKIEKPEIIQNLHEKIEKTYISFDEKGNRV